MQSHTFKATVSGRLDKVLSEHLGNIVSREKIKQLIKAGHCSLDAVPCQEPSRKIRAGQCVDIVIPPEQTHLEPENGEASVLWEDDTILVINKPAGLTVHPAPSCPQGTLIQRLLSNYPSLREHEGWRPGVVHRLDKDTSGLILVALEERARLVLAKAFADREVEKTYLALVGGVPPRSGSCLEPLGRHPTVKTRMAVVPGGRHAHTEWQTLYTDSQGRFSLLAIQLHTGRTHQIRVHMAHLGHALLGDKTYAPKPIAAMAPRQMLHAWKIAFSHPVTGVPCSFVCPPPSDMADCLERLTWFSERVVITGLPGCGKSRLTRMMQEEGYPGWSADEAVRQCYEPEGDGWQALHHRYRGRFTAQGAPVDKQALAIAIRETPGMREEVESLIHPIVNQALAKFWDDAEETHATLAFAEVPLWLESGGQSPRYGPSFGRITLVGVDCPDTIRHDRLIRLRHWQEAMVIAADSWQWPADKKMAACDLVIDNSGTEDRLLNKGHALVATLLARREDRQRMHSRAWQDIFCEDPSRAGR